MSQFPNLRGGIAVHSEPVIAWQPMSVPESSLRAGWMHLSSPGSRGPSVADDAAALQIALAGGNYAAFAHLIGDRTIAWIDAHNRELTVARDPMGLQPVYYRTDGGLVGAASTAAALKLPGLPLTVDPAWIARYSWMSQSDDLALTPYREIRKLPPGHMLVARPGEPPIVRPWHSWERDGAPLGPAEGRDWVGAYRVELLRAVTSRLGTTRPVAFEASGGLDSSSLLAAALQTRRLGPDDVRALGYAICEHEPAAIAAVLDHLNVRHRRIYETPDVVQPAHVDRALAAIGYPEENSIASSYWRLLEDAAADEAKVVLSGYGGDEIVSRPAVEARHDFVAGHELAHLHGSFAGDWLRRTAATAWHLLPRPPSAAVRAARRRWIERWSGNLLTEDAAASFGIRQAHMRALDQPLAAGGVNATIRSRHLPSASMTTRFESCFLVGQSFGVSYAWPLCDQRLIALYLAAPAAEKLGPGGVGRYLHRRAIAAWLPPEVAGRPTKYLGQPRHLPLAEGPAMSDWATPDLVPALRGIIDPAKVAAARQTLAQATALSGEVMAIRSSLARLAWLTRWLDSEA